MNAAAVAHTEPWAPESALAADVEKLAYRKAFATAKDLLCSLLPRAECFCFYDREAYCVWNSEDNDDFEIDTFVAGLGAEILNERSEEKIKRTLGSGRTLLGLQVRSGESAVIGLLLAVFSKNAGKSSSFNPDALAAMLAPAVDTIGQGFFLNRQLENAFERVQAIEDELQLVYAVDEKVHGTSHSHAGLAHLVGQSGRFLGISYSLLVIPSKRIRISATHSSWKEVHKGVLDRYVVDHLLPKLEGSHKPAVFDIPGIEGSENAAAQGFQTLLTPIVDRHDNVEGVIAQLGRVEDRPFTKSDRRFMSHVGRKAEYLIERSFDAMTGHMNRAGFEAQLVESYRTLESDEDAHQIIYFDLDNLQLVNDTFGRSAGDEVIKRFARLLEQDLPRSAVISRLTGDDFCILLTHANADDALKLAETAREEGKKLRYLEGDKSLQVTMSVGIAEFDLESGKDGKALTNARMTCEAAKDHGRDRIEVYDDTDQSIIRRHDDMQLVSQIQQMLDANEFRLLAQPIACINGGDIRPRFEVLLRMKDGDGVNIPTAAFFSAAERYQLMPQVDRWVLSTTISKLTRKLEVVRKSNAVFAINLSGQSLGDDGILEFIEFELEESKLPPESLCFEITESAAVSNLRKAQAFIDTLRDRGCSISLDDFGAGLSSFAYLKNFNVDTLKIDGSFIRDIAENRISESMVAAITQVAKVMELNTVAEYVESDQVRELITKIGVDFAQGHGIGKPVEIDKVLAILKRRLKQAPQNVAVFPAS